MNRSDVMFSSVGGCFFGQPCILKKIKITNFMKKRFYFLQQKFIIKLTSVDNDQVTIFSTFHHTNMHNNPNLTSFDFYFHFIHIKT